MAQAASPAGHYVLRGVMEVGSELLLKPDGTFEFALAYGATDYYAKGTPAVSVPAPYSSSGWPATPG